MKWPDGGIDGDAIGLVGLWGLMAAHQAASGRWRMTVQLSDDEDAARALLRFEGRPSGLSQKFVVAWTGRSPLIARWRWISTEAVS
jgi:hypothetical protein